MYRLISGLFLAAAAACVFAFYSDTGVTSAEVEGDCEAFFSGIDVSELDSDNLDDAIPVAEDDVVDVRFSSGMGFESHSVEVKFADIPGGSVNVEDEEDGGDTEWTGTVNVDDWAWAGGGLYKVEGSATLSDGSECTGAVLIDVDKPFYETVAGLIALFLTAFGAGSVAVAGMTSVLEGRRTIKRIDDWAINELDNVSRGQPYTPPQRRDLIGGAIDNFCLFVVLPALILTGAAMAAGEGTKRSLNLPRAVWRPRLSVSGIVGGIVAGLGVVVVLQQAGQIFPGTGTILLWIGLGLVLGVVVPSLMRALNVISVNRSISRAERRLLEAGAAPDATRGNPPAEG